MMVVGKWVLELAALLADRTAPVAVVRMAVAQTILGLVADLLETRTDPAYRGIVGTKDLTA